MKTRARLATLLAVPLLASFALAACSTATTSPAPGGMMSQSSPDAHGMMGDSEDAAASDIAFAQMMIPHHEQAVEMSKLAPERASSSFIRDLASRIQGAQQPEIDQMAAWLQDWGVPRMTMMESMTAHGGHGMAGIVSDADMTRLEQAKGAKFDQLYAQFMIDHHLGAIAMAKGVEDSSNPEVAALAKAIISAQQDEIAQMREFLKQ